MKVKDWLIFLLLGGIWSSSFLWIKIAVQEIGPITLVAFRVLFGLLFGVAVVLIGRVKLPRRWSEWMPLMVLGIINVAIPFFLISWGEQSINSAVAAILDATVPLFAIVIAHLGLHDDKITLPKVAGLLLGFLGVVVLMSKDLGAPAGSLLGQAAVVLASIFYAGGSVYARLRTEIHPRYSTKRRTVAVINRHHVGGRAHRRSAISCPAASHHMGGPVVAWHPRIRFCLHSLLLLDPRHRTDQDHHGDVPLSAGRCLVGGWFPGRAIDLAVDRGALLIVASLAVANLRPRAAESKV